MVCRISHLYVCGSFIDKTIVQSFFFQNRQLLQKHRFMCVECCLIVTFLYIRINGAFIYKLKVKAVISEWAIFVAENFPDSKVHVANIGPIWRRQDPGGPHVGPMKVVIWVSCLCRVFALWVKLLDICIN